ncbi:uncharacterized protein L201_001552 [Kwoniella dendrophila CBS 6074]|uniref:Uncharacterized protein n=1 Tax=Kwoniella dendrophila CBS 6074 TaxID=1295534 RepID=A0AAX4JQ62_9TREE
MRPTTFLILTLILPFAPTINSSAIAASDDHASVSLQDEYDRYKSNNIEDKIRREEAALSTLSRSLTRSQCHANIAKTLKHSCQGAVDDVGNRLSEHNKRGLAISFTICSMQSALQKIPSECSQWNPFSSDGLNQNENYSLGSDLPEHNDLQEQQASCLSALHRSPQEWSAYNVYLSDTTQLCHALEARKQADLAHTRYVEANVEKVALLKLMKERESAQLARERNLSKDWENSSAALKRTSDLVFSAQQQLREDIDISSELRQDLRSTIKNLDLERAAVWGRIEKDVNDRLFEADVRFETILYSMRDGWAADYDLAVDDRIKEAEIATNTWIQNTTIQVADIFAYMTSQMLLGRFR